MQQHQLAAYIIPSSDPHLSEYVANHWKSRGHFSGFTGSAGTLVITLNESGLWTDGRYFIQAEAQLSNSEIKLFRMGQPNVPTVSAYLASVLNEGERVGFDGKLFSIHQVKEMEKLFSEKSIEIESCEDLVAILWENRPEIPATEAFVHEVQYTGFTCAEKLGQVRAVLEQKNADGYVMNLLDSIAWLFNIRAADVEFNPMVISYGVVLKDEAYLFVNEVRINDKVRKYLKENGVTIKSYDEIDAFLMTLTDCRLVCDYGSLNYSLYEVLSRQSGVIILNEADIVTKLKAIKNEVEIKNTKLAQIKDGCAVVHTILHIEDLLNKNEKVTEYDVTKLLEHYRLQQNDSYGSSFSAIVGYQENAAMMHYSPKKESSSALEQKGFLLIDSGGHYLDGTTDLTRTFTLGKTSEEAKKHYT
ncbi:MAG: aminopeptidase P family N-terminal domain-containing protein, partial [Turicibacter sp.]